MDITGIKRQICCCNRERYTVQLLDLPGFSNLYISHGSVSVFCVSIGFPFFGRFYNLGLVFGIGF